MNKQLILVLSTVFLFFSCKKEKKEDLTQFVDPFIGIAYVGHTHPAAQLPFGMVQVGPDTGTDKWEHCAGYFNEDSSIIGFSHTHLSGTGCPDMGDVMFMPVTGDVSFYRGDEDNTATGYRSGFRHETEEARPGYYKVLLDDYQVKVELTATERTAFHKYTFPESENAGIIIDLGHGIGDKPVEASLSLLNDTTVVGKRRSTGFVEDHTYYFYAVLSKPVEQVSSFVDSVISQEATLSGKTTKFLLQFKTGQHEEVRVKVALSTVNIDGAKRNMQKEITCWNFNEVRSKATATWNEYLEKIEISPRDEGQKISFYTAVYHTLVMPNKITDVDGTYRLPDGTLIKDRCERYTNFSLWDTYRAAHPFYVLMFPDKNTGFVESMLDLYRQRRVLCTNEYGQNETWCMIGNHAVSVVADAYLKGTITQNKELAAEAVFNSLTTSHPKSNWEMYDQYGYYPFDLLHVESVSRTMEHCYNDYCASLMAELVGDREKQIFFKKRSDNFKNLFDSDSKLMRAKDSNGNWRTPFDSFLLSHASTSGGDYTEGNAWQYTWHIQHDIPELVKLMGSKDYFETKLDSLFFLETRSLGDGFHGDVTGMIGQYAHGNEPSHHIAYLYNYTNHPYKTQEIIRQVFDQFYLPTRDGLSGNDDCGQMSAWYIFSSMGFYPVDPVSGEYIIGAPQVHEMILHLPNGKTFEMKANNLSDENKYIQSVKLNGQPLPTFKISYNDIKKGGILEFDMGAERAKKWVITG
ncbi:GH92 family glycosyl hydrolase [Prolixibacteraceae bacterium Z1-6]|uniref:GH92 family glycosyl hydrolase n=1 Tax=Draconibacterium aestuarii TaxID=2998507 RepID=A0A9X3F356_9BACT|nr:GH92 family glycosyl hydrolase [Prolixibacteraceae bacterium Z1-6]